MVKKYIQSQIQEIKTYKSLRWYGFFLSLVHVITFIFWHHNVFIHQYLTKNANIICWPQIPFCESLRFLSPIGAQIFLYFYLSLAFLAAFFFLRKKAVIYAYGLLLIVNLMETYVFFTDYRVIGNYHYMPLLISFMYLFIRQKLFFIPLSLACFYFFSAILKISNLDWVTGLAIPRTVQLPFVFNEDIKIILCFYVVCLQMIGTWFLVLNTRWKWAIYIHFILFHAISYFAVGYFFPMIMMCLLSLFLFMFIFNEKHNVLNIRSMLSGIFFMGLVIAGNILSAFIPGDASLTGEGHYYAFSMHDALTECDSQIFLKFQDKTIQESFSGYKEHPLRIRCDPYIDFNTVRKICAYYKSDSAFVDLDWSVYSKLQSDLNYQRLIDENNVCSKNLQYFSWKKNNWIKVERSLFWKSGN